MRRHRFATALALLVAFALRPADAAPAISNETISVWTHEDVTTPEFAALKAAADAFNTAHAPRRVEILPSIYRTYEERVQSAAATGALPCLLEFDGPFQASFAWPGYLQPIDRFVPPDLRQDLLPSLIAQGTYEGRLYSLGQFDSGLGLWGNRRYLAAAGIRIPTIAAPWTLAEFEHALEKLTQQGGAEYALDLGVYLSGREFYPYAYSPILQGFGGDLIGRGSDGRASDVLDGPQSVTAMKHVQSWFQQGWARAVFDRSDDFPRGRAALSWGGHWQYRKYQEALGEDLVLMPLPDFGRGIKTGIGSWVWGITSTCHDPAGAWAFLAHLLSGEEILRMTDLNGAVPGRRSVLPRSQLYGTSGPLRLFARQLDAGLGVPRPITPAYGTIREAFTAAVRAIIGGADVRTELSTAADIIDQDITAHNGYPP